MPSEKSHRAHSRRAVQNKIIRTFARNRVALARDGVASGEASNETVSAVKNAISALDIAARKGVIHRNQAARKKSRLQRRLNAISGS
jgi:small subunit ribosomal protein S20